MRRLLLALAFMLASAVPGLAQTNTAYFAINYDVALEQPTFTYCTMNGARGDPFQDPIPVAIPIDTVGSNTTVEAVTPGTNPFANVGIGDRIFVRLGSGTDQTEQRTVITNADDDTITVDTAVDWSAGYEFSYLDLVCGTAATDGWINVTSVDTIQMTVEYAAGDLTGLDVVYECKEGGGVNAVPVQVYPGPSSECGFGTLNTNVCTFVLGDVFSRKIPENIFSFCRVGLAWRTADGGTADEVTATFTGRNMHIGQ